MKHKVVQVYVNDGSALYIDGKLISRNFTVGESDLLEALGYVPVAIRADHKYYLCRPWPELLKDVKTQ